MQNYCFLLSNMQICDVLVAVVVLVAKAPSSENLTSLFCNLFQLFKVIMLEKCHLTVLELNWNMGFDLSSYAQVVHATAKQVIFRRGKNENVFKMSKDGKCTCKACKNTVFHCQICKFVGFLLPSSSRLLKLPKNVKTLT